uniref:IZUMO family member 4 n=1 Tax=Marmota marmota marmota TaxID=9994 RepID=A0A8C5ZUS8_MARMA
MWRKPCTREWISCTRGRCTSRGISPMNCEASSGTRCTSSRTQSLKAALIVSVTVVSEPGSWLSGAGWWLRLGDPGGPAAVSCVAGIFQYETISCNNCTDSHVVCFGYNCKSSAQWETAVRGLLSYM